MNEWLEWLLDNFDPASRKEVQLSESIRLHYEQDIDLARQVLGTTYPSEPTLLREYRLSNIYFITKAYFDKVYSIIYNLRNEPEFEVVSNGEIDEVLSYYYGIPNILDYVFDKLLILLFVDPNALVINVNKRLRVIRSKDLVYKGMGMVVFRDAPTSDGKEVFALLSYGSIIYYVKNNGNWEQVSNYEVTFLPEDSFYIGGPPADVDQTYYTSIIGGAIGSWTNALITYSDLTCNMKQHAYPEKYRYITEGCRACDSTGTYSVETQEGKVHTMLCRACKGTGKPATGVFSEVQIDVSKLVIDNGIDGTAKLTIPTPPIGYVKKDIETIEFVDKKYKDFIREGLSALSMEFLSEVPEQQSGAAKLVDRAELTIYLKSVLSHIANLIKNVGQSVHFMELYYLRLLDFNYPNLYEANQYRVHIPNQLVSFLPTTNEDVSGKAESNNQAIRYGQDEQNIDKLFSGNEAKKQKLILYLDPLKGMDLAQKLLLKEKGLVSAFDVFLSVRLPDIVEQHIRDDGWALKRKDFSKTKDAIMLIATEMFNSVNPQI